MRLHWETQTPGEVFSTKQPGVNWAADGICACENLNTGGTRGPKKKQQKKTVTVSSIFIDA